MKGQMYEIEVSDGFMEWSHGMTYTIIEYYVPSAKIFFNFTNGIINVFQVKDRMKNIKQLQEVDIPDEIVHQIMAYFEKRQLLKDEEKQLVKFEKRLSSLCKEQTEGKKP
jgi:hypothetical protein